MCAVTARFGKTAMQISTTVRELEKNTIKKSNLQRNQMNS